MTSIVEENIVAYFLGLVVYTYDDLFKRGRSLAVLIRRIRQVFPELDLEQVVVQRANASNFENINIDALQAGLEHGEFVRFQVDSSPGNDDQPFGLIRASLGGEQMVPPQPNYLFFGIPALYYAEETESVHSRLITIGRETFDFLNGVYGFAHLGFIELGDNETLPPLDPPLAIPPTDFRNLYIPTDLSNCIPYLFWANWLGRAHVDRLGGLENIQKNLPKARVDRMSRGAVLVTSYSTPLSRNNDLLDDDLYAIANFLVTPLTAEPQPNEVEDSDIIEVEAEQEPSPEERNQQIAQALQLMATHVERFEKDYLQNDKAPRNYVWRPYRFCTQDVVLGLTVVRHSVDNNCLEVDVCLTAELPEFEEGSSARVMWSFLLSEAFKCGGTMEIRFSENVEDGHVPISLAVFAQSSDVSLAHVSEGRVTSGEARRVYLAITQFEPRLRDQILALASEGRLSPERACYAVHRGLWTQPELTQLVLGTQRADRILSGETPPEHRLLYRDDIVHARAALLGGFLDRKLLKRVRNESDDVIDREDDVLPIEIDYAPSFAAKTYLCSEPFPLPWLANGQASPSITTTSSIPLVVLIRAREREELELYLETDLALARQIRQDPTYGYMGANTAVLVPRDFEDISPSRQTALINLAGQMGVKILVCPETTTALDTEAARRFTSSRIIRE